MKKLLWPIFGLIFSLYFLIIPKVTFAADWVNIGFPDKVINSFFADPLNKDRIIASVAGIQVYFTEDGGKTWQASSMVPVASPCNEFAQNPVSKNEIWAACTFGLYHSTDYGHSFTRSDYILLKSYNVFHVKLNSKGTIFVNTSAGTILRSYDGLIWQSVPIYGAGYPSIDISPYDDSLYVSYIGTGLYKSTDYGRTSTLINNTDAYHGFGSMVFLKDRICGIVSSFMCSTNGGYNWGLDTSLPAQNDNYVYSVAQNPDDPGNILLARVPRLSNVGTFTLYSRKSGDTFWSSQDLPYRFDGLKISQGVTFAYNSLGSNGLWRNDGIAVQPEYLEKYPVIIVPGILGSWQKNGEWEIDPILGKYNNLINSLEEVGYEKDKDLFTFPYEWRQDNSISAEKLKAKIAEIKKLSGKTKVIIIAHSMGGLVTRSYAEGDSYDNDISEIIFLGTPHVGSPKSYVAWESGDLKFQNGIAGPLLNFAFSEEAKINGFSGASALFDYIRHRIVSLHQLLPIFNYLKIGNSFVTYPNTYPENEYLENLELNKRKLVERNIKLVNIIGEDSNNTVSFFDIVRPSGTFPFWEDGIPPNYYFSLSGVHFANGDDTVLSDCHLNIGEKTIILRSSHTDIPTNAVNFILDELNKNANISLTVNKINYLLIAAHSPVDFYVQAPDGKRIGFNKETGGEFAEMDNAFYSGNDPSQPEFVVIRNPEQGEYKVTTIGTGNGDYEIESVYANDTTNQELDTKYDGTAVVGVENKLNVNLNVEKGEISSENDDKVPPNTTIGLTGQKVGEFYNTPVRVELNSFDAETGVKEVDYSFDGIVWNKFDTLTLENDGIYDLQYRALDNAGNVEGEHTEIIKIDKTDPTIVVSLNKNELTHWEKLNVEVDTMDNLSGIKEKHIFVDGKEVTGLTNIDLFQMDLGVHEVKAIAEDNAGNSSILIKTFRIFADFSSTKKDLKYLYKNGDFKSYGTMINLCVKMTTAEVFNIFQMKQKTMILNEVLKDIDKEFKNKQLSDYGYNVTKSDVLYLLGG